MKPYFEQHGITLYVGDCREVIPLLGPFSLCMADPPYGETNLEWDELVEGWLGVVQRALYPTGSMWCFGSLRMFMHCSSSFFDAGFHLSQDVVWEKHNGSNNHDDRFKRVHEQAAHFYLRGAPWAQVYKKPVMTADAVARRIHRRQKPTHFKHVESGSYESLDGGPRFMRSVIHARSCHGYAIHPTQKPEPVVDPLVEYACPPDGRIVVPFAGSGTDLVIAKLRGIEAVGVEIDERMAERCANRISSVLPLSVARHG